MNGAGEKGSVMRKTPPKKYADKRRTKVTDEWLEWDAATRGSEDDWDDALAAGYDPAMYFPEAIDKAIPDEGAWILVLEEPFTPIRDRFRVPLLSMWRARPHSLNSAGFRTRAKRTIYPQQAVIATPAGDLHLWPHEYMLVTNPMGLAADPDAELHALGGEPVLNQDELFYLQSRGIPHQDAVMLLFARIQSFDFVYVTFPEEITSALEGVGRPLHRHLAFNPR